jgi:hypothetical protein
MTLPWSNCKKTHQNISTFRRVEFYLPKKGDGEALPACCMLAPHVISQNRIQPFFLRLKMHFCKQAPQNVYLQFFEWKLFTVHAIFF